jgi:hypothetical protein
VSWADAKRRITTGALQKLNVVSAVQAVSAEDAALASTTLERVLGSLWDQLPFATSTSASTLETLPAGAASMPAPADYLTGLEIKRLDFGGSEVPLAQLSYGEWLGTAREQTGVPSHYFLSPQGEIFPWPVPVEATALRLFYRHIPDAAFIEGLDGFIRRWEEPLIYILAEALIDDFAVSELKIARIVAKASALKPTAMVASASPRKLHLSVRE